MQVVVTGRVDVYERDGRYQLYASSIERDGMGELYERFIKLKEELEDRGLFAPEYKSPLPASPKTVGVVTASTGAAIRDIISVAKGRDPYVQIILYPATVQGESAPESICKGIKLLEKKQVDVMIVGRGGGSLEDLMAFNDERVAQAIFDCSIPIISAVGHETDTTIADYVADVRAETPTAAAALATVDRDKEDRQLYEYGQRLNRLMEKRIESCKERLRHKQVLLTANSPKNRILSYRHRSMLIEERLQAGMDKAVKARKERLALLASGLDGVSPLLKLSQGYSYTDTEDGDCVNSIKKVKPGDMVGIHVKDGIIKAEVKASEAVKRDI